MVCPEQETPPCCAPTEVVVARILDDEFEILLTSKVERSLGILCLPNVDTDGWNTSLRAWDFEGGV